MNTDSDSNFGRDSNVLTEESTRFRLLPYINVASRKFQGRSRLQTLKHLVRDSPGKDNVVMLASRRLNFTLVIDKTKTFL